MLNNVPPRYHSPRRRANATKERPSFSGLHSAGPSSIHAPIRNGLFEMVRTRLGQQKRVGEVRVRVAWFTTFLLVCVLAPRAADPDDGRARTLQGSPPFQETFQQYPAGVFPSGWQVRGNAATAQTVYHIAEEEGNRFLHAYAKNQDVQIGIEYVCKPQDYPILRWRWRATKLPPGANERAKKTNDSAAAVYVIFDSSLVPRAIKYVWSSTLAVGARFDSPVYWRAKVIVLQRGPAEPGEWRQESVNFYQDYKDLFGFEPGEVRGIAVLSDSDTMTSVSEAAYDDFMLLPGKTPSRLNPAAAAVTLSLM